MTLLQKQKIAFLVILISILTFSVAAHETEDIARIVNLTGRGMVRASGKGEWAPAGMGTVLNDGDILKTGEDSSAVIDIVDRAFTATIKVGSNSQLMFLKLSKGGKSDTEKILLDLAVGKITVISSGIPGKGQRLEIKTPTSIISTWKGSFSVEVERAE